MTARFSIHSRSEATFARQSRNDGLRLQSSPAPLRGWWSHIGAGVFLVGITIASMWLLGSLAELCTQMGICL